MDKRYFTIQDEKGNIKEYSSDSSRQLKNLRAHITKTYPIKLLNVSRIMKRADNTAPMFLNIVFKRRR